jgi:hypothetical protein
MNLETLDAPVKLVPPPSREFSVYRVLPECLDLMWPVAEPLLAKAVAREHGRFTIRDIYRWIKTSDQQLWVVTSGGRCIAAGLVRLQFHPTGKRAATLHLLGGSQARAWALPAWEAWSSWCRLAGITELHIVGRKGWERLVARFGFQREAVILTREEV